jgi:hypothetical protein
VSSRFSPRRVAALWHHQRARSSAARASRRNVRPYDVMGRVSALVSAAARVETVSQLRSTIDEYIQGGSSAEQAAALDDFANKPLVVLTAGSGSDADWSAAQDEMATLSTNSAYLVVQGATHASMISDEADAAATTQAILDVVSSVRSSGLLVR